MRTTITLVVGLIILGAIATFSNAARQADTDAAQAAASVNPMELMKASKRLPPLEIENLF